MYFNFHNCIYREKIDWSWSPSPERITRSRRKHKSGTREINSVQYSTQEDKSRYSSGETRDWNRSPSPERRKLKKFKDNKSDYFSERDSDRSSHYFETECSRHQHKDVQRHKHHQKRSSSEEDLHHTRDSSTKNKKKNRSRKNSVSNGKEPK